MSTAAQAVAMPRSSGGPGLAADLLSLTKPGITFFIAMTAAAGYLLANGGAVRVAELGLTILATALTSGGAAALNQILERDADARMRRTARRPVAAGRIGAAAASTYAAVLIACGLCLSIVELTPTATLLLVASILSYVALYTPLKRVTSLCTLAGAIPGALPILVGWSAGGSPIDAAGASLFAVLYLWQIPHFLAIGWLCREDYARGGFRILSVGDDTGIASARQSTLYAAVLLPASLLPVAYGVLGAVYFGVALLLGGVYLGFGARLLLDPATARARRLFLFSLAYLPLLLAGMGLDRLLDR